MKKNIAVGALLSALLVGIIPVSSQARETVFDVNKIRLMKPNQGSGIEAYPDGKFNLLTNLQECREYNAKCYPYADYRVGPGSIEIKLNEPIANYTIMQTIKKPNFEKEMRITLYNDFGDGFVITLGGGYWKSFYVRYDQKRYEVPHGDDYQLAIKLVGNTDNITIYVNDVNIATVEAKLGSISSFKESFYGSDETKSADKVEKLLIINDAN